MIGFWELILLISFVCLGITIISGTEKILEPVRNWFEIYVPTFIAKPIITCCTCMASFWGSIIYWYFVLDHFSWNLLEAFNISKEKLILKWIATCLIVAFINYTIKIVLDYIKKQLEKPE